jgi:hypothetical protein
MKLVVLRTLSIIVGVTIAIIAVEILLRFFPVNEGLHTLPVNERNPIVRFEPNRTSTWSEGWNFALVNKAVKTNNFGFVNDNDYETNATTPLLAIIGDSYVQASMLPYRQTAAGRLGKYLENTVRLYTFGVSGAPLSQYLAFSEYVRDTFHPDALIIMVAGNDFDESLMKYKSAPRFHYFVEDSNGTLSLKRVDLSVSFTRTLVRKSALAMYLATNLQVQALPGRLRDFFSVEDKEKNFVGNTSAETSPMRIADSKRAIDAFLDKLPAMSGFKPSEILFVMDGMRPHLYDSRQLDLARGSYFDVMRQYFLTRANIRGYEAVDLQPVFAAHYEKHGERFEYPTDMHWNPLGHELVFKSIIKSTFWQSKAQERKAP